MQPTNAVEQPGFRSMLKKFHPRYELPSHGHMSRTAIPPLSVGLCDGAKATLTSNKVTLFAATTDLWSSSSSDPYMSYTVYYINVGWVWRSYCLWTHYIPEDHSGENVMVSIMLETIQ